MGYNAEGISIIIVVIVEFIRKLDHMEIY